MTIHEANEKRKVLEQDLQRLDVLTRRVTTLRNNEQSIEDGRFKVDVSYKDRNYNRNTIGEYSGETSVAICNLIMADLRKEIAIICAKHDIQWTEEGE